MKSTLMTSRRYSELEQYDSFEDRFDYLVLGGTVGRSTFGFDRHLNQDFYKSQEWKSAREITIIRDNGCDLGAPGYEINSELLVHHMNPIGADDILQHEDWIIDPEYLITTTQRTHNDIHYGITRPQPMLVVRARGDTKLW